MLFLSLSIPLLNALLLYNLKNFIKGKDQCLIKNTPSKLKSTSFWI